jgi:hypothetical protein
MSNAQDRCACGFIRFGKFREFKSALNQIGLTTTSAAAAAR